MTQDSTGNIPEPLVTPIPEPAIVAPGAPTQSVVPVPDNEAQPVDGPVQPEPAQTPEPVPGRPAIDTDPEQYQDT